VDFNLHADVECKEIIDVAAATLQLSAFEKGGVGNFG
jgi:hypothetical protein